MKKLWTTFLALVLVFSLLACSGGEKGGSNIKVNEAKEMSIKFGQSLIGKNYDVAYAFLSNDYKTKYTKDTLSKDYEALIANFSSKNQVKLDIENSMFEADESDILVALVLDTDSSDEYGDDYEMISFYVKKNKDGLVIDEIEFGRVD